MKRYIVVMLFTLVYSYGNAQSIAFDTFSGSYNNTQISRIIQDLSSRSGVQINYDSKWLEDFFYSGEFDNDSIEVVLREILFEKGLTFIEFDSQLYVVKSNTLSSDLARLLGANLTKREFSSRKSEDLIDSFNKVAFYNLRGKVSDAITTESLLGTAISANDGEYSAISDENGNYEIRLPLGKHKLLVSQLGYESNVLEVSMASNQKLDILMFEESLTLDEVVVSGNSLEDAIQKVQSSVEILNIEAIKNLPTFLGEVDVLKSISSLPGVTTVGEGASGFNVRGGNVDENLILMDGMPIFNSSHLFGFFSVFNSDIVEDFALYKGGIPAKYGGRISSILDVNTSTGDLTRHQLDGSIGLISSKLSVQGPIIKNKTSIQAGVRSAYPTYILKYFPDEQVKKSEASFYDVNAKIHHRFSRKSSLTTSTYLSADEFRFGQDTTYKWDNFGTSIQWKKSINSEKSFNVRGVFSKYNNNIIGETEGEEFAFNSSIQYVGLEGSFLNVMNADNILEVGFQSSLYDLNTGNIKPTSGTSNIIALENESDKGLESAIYGSFDKKISPKIDAQAGLRLSLFANVGPRTIYTYDDPKLPSATNIQDTLFSSGGLFEGVFGIEPRFNLRYLINPYSSLKFGYNLTRQNIHVISITSAVAPGDYWKLSDPNIPPTVANQVNLGYYTLFNRIGVSLDAYYKSIQDLLDYRDGAQVFLNPQIETALVRAKGRSYGLEVKLEKKGRLSGWISYTFSRSERNNIDENGTETWFPTSYNKPHNFNWTSNYKINRRVALSWNFVFTSGRAITIPESGYYFSNILFVNYSERNSSRIPNYHRLDLSLVIEGNLKKKGFKSRWAFSIYNLYSRRNPYSVYFDTIANNTIPQGYKLSILGQAFPSISYSFKIN